MPTILAMFLALALQPHHQHYATHPPRSMAAKHQFWRQTGHPHGWHGHVVDHIIPLACGGEDAPRNMQWQTLPAGKAKDKWEIKDCSIYGGRTHP